MKIFFAILLLSSGISLGKLIKRNFKDDLEELVEADSDIKVEIHEVETEDGHLLTVHRIKGKAGITRPAPAFLLHGFIATASDYVVTGPKNALAYQLLNEGYDVWLGNVRGCKHSLKHKTLSINSTEYWNFSFHEMGLFDLPAMLDYVLEETGSEKLFYIGHSQGASSLFVLLSMRPEYNAKIIQGHLMAPAVFLAHLRNRFEGIPRELRPLNFFKTSAGSLELDYRLLQIARGTLKVACNDTVLTSRICTILIGSFCGFNKNGFEVDKEIVPTLIDHISLTASLKQIQHFVQMHMSGKFRLYDYGQENLKKYNSSTPPSYDLSKIKSPMFIYYAENDRLVSANGTRKLTKLLSNIRGYKTIPNFNHCDFNFGKNSKKAVFDDLIAKMNENEL